MRAAGLAPAHRILYRPLQHEVADRHDESGLLGDAHEALRSHVAMVRVLPAQQRLERHHALGLDVDDRLVVHVELPRGQRRAQRRLDRDALLQALVHAGAEELEVVAAAILGLVHGGVGVAQQLAHVRTIVRVERNPDAHRGHERAAVHHHRRRERVVDAAGGLAHLVGALDGLEDDDELIPAHAHHHVLGAHRGADALRHGLQELVAGLVAARVVDVLEAVEVQEQNREHRAAALASSMASGRCACRYRRLGSPVS